MKVTRAVLGLAAAMGLAACSGDIIDPPVEFPGASIELTTPADPANVHPGEDFPLTVTVQNIYLVEPTIEPPLDHLNDAGYLVLTLDDESSTPLLATSQTNVTVTIPPSTTEGTHTIICRVFGWDGTPSDDVDELTIGVVLVAPRPPVDTTMDTSFPSPVPTPPPEPVGARD
jgi:hypothetical protein